MESEKLLVALAIKHKGDWDEIYKALTNKEINDLDEYLVMVDNLKCKYITILSEDYPLCLKYAFKAPIVLFYYGDINLLINVQNNVSVVGSRDYSTYAKEMTESIVEDLAKEYVIVSGMARGIDTIAHNAAISNGGKTIAVLGSGIDYCYPLENKYLYQDIKRDHLVISEYPGHTLPTKTTFPMRNRIIAMISRGTIVTEAYAKSGTLSTIMFALEYNRAVLCVPYPATAKSECNRLIASGAFLVENGKQAIEILKKEICI